MKDQILKGFVAHKRKAILRKYMKEHDILKLEIDWKEGTVLSLEAVRNCERAFFVDSWLKGELSTEKFLKQLYVGNFWWVQYFLDDFLDEVESWMKQQLLYQRAI